jgi:hypothetical protein
MDPEEALRLMRELAKGILSNEEENHTLGSPLMPDQAIEMAEQFEALDVWLKSGGFLPKDWSKS